MSEIAIAVAEITGILLLVVLIFPWIMFLGAILVNVYFDWSMEICLDIKRYLKKR